MRLRLRRRQDLSQIVVELEDVCKLDEELKMSPAELEKARPGVARVAEMRLLRRRVAEDAGRARRHNPSLRLRPQRARTCARCRRTAGSWRRSGRNGSWR